jgi:hypothetical protein
MVLRKRYNKMNTKFIARFTALLASSTLLFGCTVNLGNSPNMTIGSGKVVTESRTISGVNAVVATGSGRLIVEQGDVDSLTITADDNILPLLTSTVLGGKLTLGMRQGSSFSTRSDIVYKVTVKTLNEVGISGSANGILTNVKTDSFKVVLSGSGNLTASGSAATQDIVTSGSGNFNGDALTGAKVNARTSGSGNITVNASEELNASTSGSGNIYYKGNPSTVNPNSSGSGKVMRK